MSAIDFIARIAALDSPYDPERMKVLKAQYAECYRYAYDGCTDDEVISDTPSDDCFDDAKALWKLVMEAREIIAAAAL